MGKVIMITNEPSFNEGVVSYVRSFNAVTTHHSSGTDIDKAKVFEDDSKDLEDAYKQTLIYFDEATVEIIDK